MSGTHGDHATHPLAVTFPNFLYYFFGEIPRRAYCFVLRGLILSPPLPNLGFIYGASGRIADLRLPEERLAAQLQRGVAAAGSDAARCVITTSTAICSHGALGILMSAFRPVLICCPIPVSQLYCKAHFEPASPQPRNTGCCKALAHFASHLAFVLFAAK